jgi:hypothetical protein
METCFWCGERLWPVYNTVASVFIPGLGYLVKNIMPIKHVCCNRTCRGYLK